MEKKPSIFERLPEELRHLCLSFCDSSTVLNLCLTSKAAFQVCIHSLFHTIDLSTHNQSKWRRHKTWSNVMVPSDYVKVVATEKEASITHRQRKLMELLNEHLDFGLQTRVLRWTTTVTDEFSPSCNIQDLRDGFNYGTNDLWGAFTCFSNITEIDLAFMTGTAELHAPPPSLFSTATSVSLSGIASYRVIATILDSIDPTKLRHLRFNNLQTFMFSDDSTLSRNIMDAHRLDRQGQALGFLAKLTGHCPTLRSFHYICAAAFLDGGTLPWRRFQVDWPTQIADENRRYAEVGAFIDSVKPTLRELYFEHGPDTDYFESMNHPSQGILPGQTLASPLPMDVFFDTHIFPVLISGPWQRLRSMTVRGIGHWKFVNAWRADAPPDEIRWLHCKTADFRQKAITLWEAAPEGCKVVVKDEARRPFYRFQSDYTADGSGQLL